MPVNQPPPSPADGSEAVNDLARRERDVEKRWRQIRSTLASRLISCNDCRQLRDSFVMVMDLLTNEPIPEEKPTLMTRTSRGTQVAPGVEIIPPAADGAAPPGVQIIPPATSPDGAAPPKVIVIPPSE